MTGIDSEQQPTSPGAEGRESSLPNAAAKLIASLKLKPIPQEGAWFVEGPRTGALSTITVLLTRGIDGFSAMHRLDVDEGWQWLGGDPAAQLRLHEGRVHNRGTLGVLDQSRPQALVRAGDWQGAATLGDWTLLSCWCSPAYRPRYFTLGEREHLTAAFPDYAGEVASLTRA